MKSIKHVLDNGDIEYLNEEGEFHRTNGPAVIWKTGSKEWCIKDKYHRLDGPAVIWHDGSKEWWLNGIQYTEDEFNNIILTNWIRLFS